MSMTRRNHLKLLATAAGAAALGGNVAMSQTLPKTMSKPVKLPKYKNADFYDKDGKFLPEKGKAAYFDMMNRHGYNMHIENAKKWATDFWVTDFGLGDFVNVGMGGVFWVNFQEFNYFAHEIYLLPGQMIVEHAHEATDKGKPKMESWHARNGSVYCFGETGGEIPAGVALPKSQEKFITVKKCTEVPSGDILTLNRVTAKHFMMGGTSGGIVSEYASFHDGAGLRFTNPGVKF
jgi:D-lyxose ketol-isomerase